MNAMVSRNEDMSPIGKLVLYRQEDGDVIVVVSGDPDNMYDNSVEFCSVGSGGGRSPHTLKALYWLMDAMVKDNTERPIGTSETIEF